MRHEPCSSSDSFFFTPQLASRKCPAARNYSGAAGIRQHVKSQIEPREFPHVLTFADDLPKSAAGNTLQRNISLEQRKAPPKGLHLTSENSCGKLELHLGFNIIFCVVGDRIGNGQGSAFDTERQGVHNER